MKSNVFFGKSYGWGESWYVLFQGNTLMGTAHEDDKQGMDDLFNLMLAIQTN